MTSPLYPELNGKTALVTGASRGIGRAIACRLAKEGCAVIVNYRKSKTEAEQVLDDIHQLGGEAIAIRADISKENKVISLFDIIHQEYKTLDILVANAGFGIPISVSTATPKQWDYTMDGTAKSLMLLAQCGSILMKNGGKIISIASYGGQRVIPGYGIMGPAKSAIEGLVRTLAFELATKNIIVNGIMPGVCDTKSLRSIPTAESLLTYAKKKSFLNKNVSPEDVANVTAFLCSEQANMICGQFITVDGGAYIAA